MHTQIIAKNYISQQEINQRVKLEKDHVFSCQRHTFEFKY